MNDESRDQLDGARPVSRPVQRWALSPLDCSVHLLADCDHPPGGLTARCAAVLPTVVIQHDQPPPGPPCEDCRVLFLADFGVPR